MGLDKEGKNPVSMVMVSKCSIIDILVLYVYVTCKPLDLYTNITMYLVSNVKQAACSWHREPSTLNVVDEQILPQCLLTMWLSWRQYETVYMCVQHINYQPAWLCVSKYQLIRIRNNIIANFAFFVIYKFMQL